MLALSPRNTPSTPKGFEAAPAEDLDTLKPAPATPNIAFSVSSKHFDIKDSSNDANFPTSRRPEKRPLNLDLLPSLQVLEDWRSSVGLTIGPLAVSDEERRTAIGIFYNWRDVHAEDDLDLRVSDLVQYELQMAPDTIPHATPFRRRLSPDDAKFFYDTVHSGLMTGRYERVPKDEPLSAWDAPPVIVVKSNGSKRLTFNYRNVKNCTSTTSIGLRDVLSNPSSKFLGRGDFKSSYWSIYNAPKTRYIMSFYCPGLGQIRPVTAPQGCGGSGLVLAEAVNRIFGPIPTPHPEPSLFGEHFNAYQDDSFFAHPDFNSHASFLNDHYLPRIHWSRFMVGFGKFEAFMDTMEAVGIVHESNGVIHVKPERLARIRDWPTPTERAHVISFLGAVEFCADHLKGKEELLRPLRALTTHALAKKSFVWTTLADRAFNLAKDHILNAPPVYGNIDSEPVQSYTDASGYAGGLVITQYKDPLAKGDFNVLMFDSFAFSKAERNYGTFKRELCVIIYMLVKYSHLFNRSKTSTIYTDHRPLLGFQSAVNLHTGVYARWALILAEANVELVYIEGPKNCAADGLSRTIFPEYNEDLPTRSDALEEALRHSDTPLSRTTALTSIIYPGDADDVCYSRQNLFHDVPQLQAFLDDPWYANTYRFLSAGFIPSHIKNDKQLVRRFKFQCLKYSISVSGLLFRCMRSNVWSRCALSQDVPLLLSEAHDQHGHLACNSMLKSLSGSVWWPTMARDCKDYASTCLRCFQFGPRLPTEGLRFSLSFAPFMLLGIDYIEFFPSQAGNKYVLHIIDYFTRFSRAFPTPKNDCATTVQILSSFFSAYMHPLAIYHDGGSHFTGQETISYLKSLDILPICAPSGSSQACGMIERNNGLLEQITRKLCNEDDVNWDLYIEPASSALNSRVVAHGFTPLELLFGSPARSLLDNRGALRDVFEADKARALERYNRTTSLTDEAILFSIVREEMLDQASDRLLNIRTIMQAKEAPVKRLIYKGDLVWLYQSPSTKDKVSARWRGPFLVTKSFDSRSFQLTHLWSSSPLPGRYPIHHLKVYHRRPAHLVNPATPDNNLLIGPYTLHRRRKRR